jgi:hypothetical protein
LVGIDSIRKLTTPGSVAIVREQDESASGRRSRREVRGIEEVKEKAQLLHPHPR